MALSARNIYQGTIREIRKDRFFCVRGAILSGKNTHILSSETTHVFTFFAYDFFFVVVGM